MFGAKSAKTHNNSVEEVNNRCDVVATDFYVSQLRNFLAKNSLASFDCRKNQQKQVAEHQVDLSTYLPNSCEPKNQHKDFKGKCKRAVYKFMKGLLDERKLKKIKSFNQAEPIYFEVSLFSIHIYHFISLDIMSPRSVEKTCGFCCLMNACYADTKQKRQQTLSHIPTLICFILCIKHLVIKRRRGYQVMVGRKDIK